MCSSIGEERLRRIQIHELRCHSKTLYFVYSFLKTNKMKQALKVVLVVEEEGKQQIFDVT